MPELLPGRDFSIEVRTNYSGGAAPLKEQRVVRSEFPVRQAEA